MEWIMQHSLFSKVMLWAGFLVNVILNKVFLLQEQNPELFIDN